MAGPKPKGRRKSQGGLDPHTPIADEFRPSIPEGDYQAICYKTEVGLSGWSKELKCYIGFRLYGGKYDGIELFMACTHEKGKMKLSSKYYTQWMLAAGRRPHAGEKLSPSVFKNKLYRVQVRSTRRKTSDGRLRPEYMQYSVIDTILETLTGIPSNEI